MTLSRKLIEHLNREGIQYDILPHTVTYTAQETAASIHTAGREVAKALILTDGTRYAMAVLEAPQHLDFDRFARVSGMKQPRLATEAEIRNLFPDCEVGAMPPFGSLYGIPTWVDSNLDQDEHLSFDGGSHYEVMRISYGDFKTLAKPRVASIAAG
jgi:Ala-tRNA(Pro) deacylase